MDALNNLRDSYSDNPEALAAITAFKVKDIFVDKAVQRYMESVLS